MNEQDTFYPVCGLHADRAVYNIQCDSNTGSVFFLIQKRVVTSDLDPDCNAIGHVMSTQENRYTLKNQPELGPYYPASAYYPVLTIQQEIVNTLCKLFAESLTNNVAHGIEDYTAAQTSNIGEGWLNILGLGALLIGVLFLITVVFPGRNITSSTHSDNDAPLESELIGTTNTQPTLNDLDVV